MQSEETSAETLENLHYPGQHQASGVLNISEQGAHFDEAMGTDVHGLKRPPESDDEGDEGVLSEDIKPKKKTRGRVKIEMKFITNKLRRYTTFSKRKTGIMKKAYELSTLTGTQVMLLVASETGHVYTFATRKLQPMITSESGKALIQTCLNSPDLPVTQIPNTDQRMSATGYEETDLTYTVGENDSEKDRGGMFTTQQMETNQGINVMGSNGNSMTGITALSAGHSFPITTYIPPSSVQQGSKAPSSFSVQAMPGGGFTTIFTPGTTFSGTPLQLGQTLTQGQQQGVQVLTQPLQIQRSQHQNQGVATCVTTSPSVTTTHTTPSVPLVHETHIQHQEHTMEQGNNMQSIGTVVVPITNQDGSVSLGNVVPSLLSTTQSGQIPVMYSVYASPSSGLVTVANLPDGTTDHSSAQQLTADGTEVTHCQSLSNSLTLAAVQVQQDMAGNMQNYSQAVSTQTPDEVHAIVSDGTLTVSSEAESELDKDGVPVPSNQTEV